MSERSPAELILAHSPSTLADGLSWTGTANATADESGD
jgi:hypothetical protein